MIHRPALPPLFFFNDTATTEIYTLSLHDALPISTREQAGEGEILKDSLAVEGHGDGAVRILRRSSGTSRVCSNWRPSMSRGIERVASAWRSARCGGRGAASCRGSVERRALRCVGVAPRQQVRISS